MWGGFLNTNLANLDTYLGVLRQAAKVLTIGATTTLDFNAPASVFKLTVTQATTIAIANTPANITTQQLATQFTLILVNGGAFTVTWPGSFVWSGGVAPSLQTSGTDVIVGWSPDNGTTWYTAGLMLNSTGTKNVTVLTPVTGSTTSQAEVSLATVTVPAGKLANLGDRVRITAILDVLTTGIVTARVKFGATYVATLVFATTPDAGTIEVEVVRTGAASQFAFSTKTKLGAPTGPTVERTLPAETLSGTVVVDFRGFVGNTPSDTLTLRSGTVELVTS